MFNWFKKEKSYEEKILDKSNEFIQVYNDLINNKYKAIDEIKIVRQEIDKGITDLKVLIEKRRKESELESKLLNEFNFDKSDKYKKIKREICELGMFVYQNEIYEIKNNYSIYDNNFEITKNENGNIVKYDNLERVINYKKGEWL